MLKDYLLDVMQQHEHGLYMCELPTGNTLQEKQRCLEYRQLLKLIQLLEIMI